MENPITREEHEEFRRRLEEENKRQDTRIGILEDSVRQIGALATSVEKLHRESGRQPVAHCCAAAWQWCPLQGDQDPERVEK